MGLPRRQVLAAARPTLRLSFQRVPCGSALAPTVGMNITAISNLLPTLLQTSNSSATGQTSQTSLDPSTASDTSISPLARFLSLLQQLQQEDPNKFKQVVSGIADRLRELAKTAAANGNSSQADQINKLADQFQNAAKDGQLPTAQDLEQAGLSIHHHHGRHHHGQESAANLLSQFEQQASDSNSNSLLTSILGSSTDSAA
jgi:hypothetical protein